MKFLYPFFIKFYAFFIQFASLFNSKAKLFVKGRKNVFDDLEDWCFLNSKQTIWFHAASLGEFEQGRPLIEYIKRHFPQYSILLTFFSPSGYEVRKNYEHADHICYLPLDSSRCAKKFIFTASPIMAFFIKYEFWNNYFKVLKNQNIPFYSVSSIFRKNQVYFKNVDNFHNTILKRVSHFFVQNKISEDLLNQIEIDSVTVTGDTRFDRVTEITKSAQSIEIVESFIDEKPTIILGSIWKEDLDVIGTVLNKHISKINLIIAPHNVDKKTLDTIASYFSSKAVRYSQYKLCCDGEFSILLIDNIGLLTSIYAYGDIAYVGGGFKTGLHNVLEPATFGVPVIFGPQYDKFDEAKELVLSEGGISINSSDAFEEKLLGLLDVDKREATGKKAKAFIQNNVGATEKIIAYLKENEIL